MGVIDQFLRERPVEILEELNDFLTIDDPQVVGFQCFPNPSSNEIHLLFDGEAFGKGEIAIYDLIGRKVFAQSVTWNSGFNEITLNPDLQAGVYVLKMGSHTEKIIRY